MQGAGFSMGDSCYHSSEQEKQQTCEFIYDSCLYIVCAYIYIHNIYTFCLYILLFSSDFSVQSTVPARAACFPCAANICALSISLRLGYRLLFMIFLSEVGNSCYCILKACKTNVASLAWAWIVAFQFILERKSVKYVKKHL